MNGKKLDDIIKVTTNWANHYNTMGTGLTDLGRVMINYNFNDYLERHVPKKWQDTIKTYYIILINDRRR